MSQMRTIGKYTITGLLGTGGQGQVHSAVDPELGRDIAIKSLHRGQGTDTATIERFRAEAKSLARIVHSNITTLIDFMAVDDHLYMIMELVRGRTLDSILQNRGKGLSIRESLAIVAQAADGLAYAHEMGVIHRDIKPSNLMITDNGRVKIMDFGIARVRGSARLTRVGSAVGTPLYMSPEQCMGSDGDERSDIYSLAIVLYELLSGSPPFQGETDHKLTEAHIRTPPPPLVPRVPGLSAKIESAIMKALSKKPEQRFHSMPEFSEALGANILLASATSVIKSHANLSSGTTSSQDVEKERTRTSLALATLLSLGRSFGRRIQALHPAVKGVGFGVAGFTLLAFFFLRGPTISAPTHDISGRDQISYPSSLSPNAPSLPGNNPRPVDDRLGRQKNLGASDAPVKKAPCNNTFVQSSGADCVPSIVPGTKINQQTDDKSLPPLLNSDNTQSPPPFAATPVVTAPVATVPVVTAPVATAPTATQLASISPTEPTIADLRSEFEKQNYGQVLELAKKLARYDRDGEGGEMEAQFMLGRLFARGQGVPKDARMALKWFEKAAVRGYAQSQYWIGHLYWSGELGAKEDCQAVKWFERAADQKLPIALHSMGSLYEKGSCGVRKDLTEATRHYRLAADQGMTLAINELKRLGKL